MKGQEVLNEIVDKTNSDLILFFVIVVIAIPIVAVILDRKQKKRLETLREEHKAEIDKLKVEAGIENNQFTMQIEREKEISYKSLRKMAIVTLKLLML